MAWVTIHRWKHLLCASAWRNTHVQSSRSRYPILLQLSQTHSQLTVQQQHPAPALYYACPASLHCAQQACLQFALSPLRHRSSPFRCRTRIAARHQVLYADAPAGPGGPLEGPNGAIAFSGKRPTQSIGESGEVRGGLRLCARVSGWAA